MKKVKILIIILIIILIVLVIGYFAIGNYFYNIALNPKTSKTFVLGEDEEETEEEINKKEAQSAWLKEKSEEVYITSKNNGNLKLHGYEIQNEEKSDIWTIVIHGYMGEAKSMIKYAQEFYKRGHNVLVIDLRGHGKSEGEYIAMGWQDRLDVIDWINYIISKNSQSEIILYGISMGAATVMMTTGEELPDNVKAAIEDCGYSSIWDEFEIQLKVLFGLPDFPVLNAASAVCKIRAGYNLKEGSSIEQLKKSNTPTLFIHGSEDKFVPFEMLDEVYQAANCQKQKLVVEGAAHAQSASVNPELYWNTIDEFLQKVW